MGTVTYNIIPEAEGWSVEHDGEISQPYATKEAAFEAAIASATLALTTGDEVVVRVEGITQPDEPVLGAS